MILLILALQAMTLHIPVYDYPGGEAILLYRQIPGGGFMVALSTDGETPSTGYADYPLSFNPAKTDAFYLPGDNILEVFSQMPYSAMYTTAVYRHDGETLTLLDSGTGNPYESAMEEITGALSEGRLEEAAMMVDGIMYPHAMPGATELCLRFLEAAARCAASGGGISCFQTAEEASMILLGRPVHGIVQMGETFPRGCISPAEYNNALEAYARALEAAGNSPLARTVREGKLQL